jgi:hypothetical protein
VRRPSLHVAEHPPPGEVSVGRATLARLPPADADYHGATPGGDEGHARKASSSGSGKKGKKGGGAAAALPAASGGEDAAVGGGQPERLGGASGTFASTGHALRMMERAAVALAQSEPVLLVRGPKGLST